MAWNYNYGYYGEPPRYVTYPEPAFVRGGLPYYEAVPVAFRQPPFYDDRFIQDFRHHHPDLGRPGFIPGEQRPDDYWRGPGYPYQGGYPIFISGRPESSDSSSDSDEEDSEQVIEYYVPLCCDNCKRRVYDYLIELPGVRDVTADQWEKKVVVVGRDLRPSAVLRSLQRYLEMPSAAFWEHRPR